METNLITNIKIKKLLRVRQRQGAKVVFLILNYLKFKHLKEYYVI